MASVNASFFDAAFRPRGLTVAVREVLDYVGSLPAPEAKPDAPGPKGEASPPLDIVALHPADCGNAPTAAPG